MDDLITRLNGPLQKPTDESISQGNAASKTGIYSLVHDKATMPDSSSGEFPKQFILGQNIAADWLPIMNRALTSVDEQYLKILDNQKYLPKIDKVFAAFSVPLANVKYVLLGESPYPRTESANGYAFWDNSIDLIWSGTGFSKALNRATSLRNFIKMLIFTAGDLQHDLSQAAIAGLDKTFYLKTLPELFKRLLKYGFLLLNSSLIYSLGEVAYHAKQWRPFIEIILQHIIATNPKVKIILLGNISKKFANIATNNLLIAEHPYNISFITNPTVNAFFAPFDLLRIRSEQLELERD